MPSREHAGSKPARTSVTRLLPRMNPSKLVVEARELSLSSRYHVFQGPGSLSSVEHTRLLAAHDLTAQVANPIARLDAKMTSRSGDGKALFPRYRPALPND